MIDRDDPDKVLAAILNDDRSRTTK
jgi:hypothetical protein